MNSIIDEILKTTSDPLNENNNFDFSFLDSVKMSGVASKRNTKLYEYKTNNKIVNSLDEDELQSDEDEYDEKQIYLCLLYQNDKLACSYYNANKKTLHTLCEIQESNKYELTCLIINELQPTLIITCTKTDEKYLKYLKMKCNYKFDIDERVNSYENESKDTEDSSSDDYYHESAGFDSSQKEEEPKNRDKERDKPIAFILMANNEFNYELAKARIMKIDKLDSMPGDMTELERIVYFNSIFNFESKLMIRSVGALLKYLDRNRVNFEFDLEESQTPICTAEAISFDNILIVDSNSLRSLGIFKNIDLACAYKQYSYDESDSFRTHLNEKSTNTLYALYLGQIQTKVGIGKLRSYLMKPIRDVKVLNERHKIIGFFHDYNNNEITQVVRSTLKKCKYINNILKRMKIAKCNLNEWKRLYNTTKAFLKIHHLIQMINHKVNQKENSSSNRIDSLSMSISSMEFDANLNTNLKSFSSDRAEKGSNFLNDADSVRSGIPSSREQRNSIELFKNLDQDNFNNLSSIKRFPKNDDDFFSKILKPDYDRKFEYLINLFERTIDLKESNETKKCRVHVNISPELDEKKQIFSQLSEYLNIIAHEELVKYDLNECNVMYIPQLGFLLVIGFNSFFDLEYSVNDFNSTTLDTYSEYMEVENENEKNAQDQSTTTTTKNSHNLNKQMEKLIVDFELTNDLRFKFKSANLYYYKNARMEELDLRFGDLASEIDDLEAEIIDKLQLEFVKYSHYYANMIDLCSELDCLQAMALVAKENNYSKPNIYIDNNKECSFIRAKKVRHPLVEVNSEVSMFIPNDVESGEFPFSSSSQTSSKIKILTAPNASGKTIYLKQVALLVYMSLIGSYVPAEEAYIGDFDRIFTRISTNESVELQMSSFAIDLNQVADAVNNSTSKSLIIIDEFGKGTDPSDGQAIIAALIRNWINKEDSPTVYLSTHFYEMLDNASLLFKENNKKIDYLTFDYLFENESLQKTLKSNDKNISFSSLWSERLIFLYTLKKGVTNSSYALNTAIRVGLKEDIVKRAGEIIRLIKENAPVCDDENLNDNHIESKSHLLVTKEAEDHFVEVKNITKMFLQLNLSLNEDSKKLDYINNPGQLVKYKAEKYREFLRDAFKCKNDNDIEN